MLGDSWGVEGIQLGAVKQGSRAGGSETKGVQSWGIGGGYIWDRGRIQLGCRHGGSQLVAGQQGSSGGHRGCILPDGGTILQFTEVEGGGICQNEPHQSSPAPDALVQVSCWL